MYSTNEFYVETQWEKTIECFVIYIFNITFIGVTRKISLWLGENHNRQNNTQKSTLISSMLYK